MTATLERHSSSACRSVDRCNEPNLSLFVRRLQVSEVAVPAVTPALSVPVGKTRAQVMRELDDFQRNGGPALMLDTAAGVDHLFLTAAYGEFCERIQSAMTCHATSLARLVREKSAMRFHTLANEATRHDASGVEEETAPPTRPRGAICQIGRAGLTLPSMPHRQGVRGNSNASNRSPIAGALTGTYGCVCNWIGFGRLSRLLCVIGFRCQLRSMNFTIDA